MAIKDVIRQVLDLHRSLRANSSYLLTMTHTSFFLFLLSSFFLTASSIVKIVVILQSRPLIKLNRPGHSCVGSKDAWDGSHCQDLLGAKDLFCCVISVSSMFSASLERDVQRGMAEQLAQPSSYTGYLLHYLKRNFGSCPKSSLGQKGHKQFI